MVDSEVTVETVQMARIKKTRLTIPQAAHLHIRKPINLVEVMAITQKVVDWVHCDHHKV